MPSIAFFAAASSSTRIIPIKPVLSHTALGQFTISPESYRENLTYSLSSTSGSVSRNGSIITVSDPNAIVTIIASSSKGGSAAPSTVERKAYTYTTPYFVQTGPFYTYNGPCLPGSTCYGTCGEGQNNCGVTPGYTTCCAKDATPSGYNDLYGEWSRIT